MAVYILNTFSPLTHSDYVPFIQMVSEVGSRRVFQVQSFLVHFWQGMPPHIGPILGTSIVVQLVGVCDSILYKTLSGVLMPTIVQPLPDR